MSLYHQNLVTLSWLEQIQKAEPQLKYHIFYCCDCRFYSYQGSQFTSISEARTWLARHTKHDCGVSVQLEGLRPQSWDRCKPKVCDTAGTERTAKQQEILQKLRALAEGTPYKEEADAAMRKIRDIVYLRENEIGSGRKNR